MVNESVFAQAASVQWAVTEGSRELPDHGKTLYDKLWLDHWVTNREDQTALIYIDRHLIHEVTSPQAFEGLKLNGRVPFRRSANLAMPDHNVPTTARAAGIQDATSRLQVETLDQNCRAFGIRQFGMQDHRQGIVHVVGPEQGAVLPGMTVVCGDSHTSTHGALACLAHGIGTSEVEHVLATQCLVQQKMKNMAIVVNGYLQKGVFAKDIILSIIRHMGTAGGTGFAIEFMGDAISALSIEGRMTLCNMAIEAGARAGMVAVDAKTIEYVRGRPMAPVGDMWGGAVRYWETLRSDVDAYFDRRYTLDVTHLVPQVSWGTSPEMVVDLHELLPSLDEASDDVKREGYQRAYAYMGLKPGMKMTDVALDRVFIGSCTNARIEDLRAAAEVIQGEKVAKNVKQALVVPGSGLVKEQAEREGLHEIFLAAGFEWREPGCSMCLAMNADRLLPKEHCASTSNRNFEGRQGFGGRTHLVSPATAARSAIAGHFA